MKVGLYIGIYRTLMYELYTKLTEANISTELRCNCICEDKNLKDLDSILFHPDPNNSHNCWAKIKSLIEQNPSKQFYILAINAPEREKFFGHKSNITYINQTNQKEFFNSPTDYIKMHKLTKK